MPLNPIQSSINQNFVFITALFFSRKGEMPLPTIQRLYDLCRASLSPSGPISEETLERVRAFLGNLQPSDVGLEQEAEEASRWTATMHEDEGRPQTPRPIKYLHLHECESFTIGVFCMPPFSTIPLHDHPGMTVLSTLLYGSLHVESYDWATFPDPVGLPELEARPARLIRDTVMSVPCETMTLYPARGGNIHSFRAVTPCAIFDILSPPYSSQHGRDCTYYCTIELDGVAAEKITWLEECEAPDDFVTERGQYKGPVISKI